MRLFTERLRYSYNIVLMLSLLESNIETQKQLSHWWYTDV